VADYAAADCVFDRVEKLLQAMQKKQEEGELQVRWRRMAVSNAVERSATLLLLVSLIALKVRDESMYCL
jgi:hypothetical protein